MPTSVAATNSGALQPRRGVSQPIAQPTTTRAAAMPVNQPRTRAPVGAGASVSQCAQPIAHQPRRVPPAHVRSRALRLRRSDAVALAARRATTASSTCCSVCLKDRHDVLIVEGVEDDAAVTARPDQAHAAQQPQLVRHRRLAQPQHRGQIADAQLAMRQRVEDPHARRIAERAEGIGQPRDRVGRTSAARILRTRVRSIWTRSQTSSSVNI